MNKRRKIYDLNLNWKASRKLPPPSHFFAHVGHLSRESKNLVAETRESIAKILLGESKKFLVIVGPCSIHDKDLALDYARKLATLSKNLPNLQIVMRAYFEKPRTTIGWKGLIYDPNLDGSNQLDKGLVLARKILLGILEAGVAPATEFLDTIIPQYLSDTIVWGAIGARTVESQLHRQLASGVSCPIGFKNTTSGEVLPAIQASLAASFPHCFPGISHHGDSCLITTLGNPLGHVILRGSYKNGSNYDDESIKTTIDKSRQLGIKTKIIIDCSHGNSNKDFTNQAVVTDSIIKHIQENGLDFIAGVMLESNIKEGKQEIKRPLTYGVSITDSCIGFEETEKLLTKLNIVIGNI